MHNFVCKFNVYSRVIQIVKNFSFKNFGLLVIDIFTDNIYKHGQFMNRTGKTKHELKKIITMAQYSGDKTSVRFSTIEMQLKNRKCR